MECRVNGPLEFTFEDWEFEMWEFSGNQWQVEARTDSELSVSIVFAFIPRKGDFIFNDGNRKI